MDCQQKHDVFFSMPHLFPFLLPDPPLIFFWWKKGERENVYIFYGNYSQCQVFNDFPFWRLGLVHYNWNTILKKMLFQCGICCKKFWELLLLCISRLNAWCESGANLTLPPCLWCPCILCTFFSFFPFFNFLWDLCPIIPMAMPATPPPTSPLKGLRGLTPPW